MMTDEQEIAIERLNRFKTIEISYSGTFAMTLIQLERLQEATEIVLDMLKEKDKEIIKLSERANEYKKAITCKDCDCSICQAHINNLKLREEIEELEKNVDRLTDEQEEKEKYVHNLERKIEQAKEELKKQIKILHERNNLSTENRVLKKQTELMAEFIDNYDGRTIKTFEDKEHIKDFFKKIAEREEK